MIYAGNHLSSSGGFAAMGKHMAKLKGDTFAFFTRNPRGGNAKKIDPEDVREFLSMEEVRSAGPLVAHAPYTLNACAAKPEVREFAHMVLAEDLARMEYIPGNYYNFHPGSHVGQGVGKGISLIADALNQVIKADQHTMILLETMAGKGTEVGSSFQEIRAIIDRVDLKEKVGVCLDTCHVWDSGYDIKGDMDGVFAAFDREIGLERLLAFHVNDSLNERGSHKDRHAVLGGGKLGKEFFAAFAAHPVAQGKPLILETPNDDAGWAEEIRFLRQSSRK